MGWGGGGDGQGRGGTAALSGGAAEVRSPKTSPQNLLLISAGAPPTRCAWQSPSPLLCQFPGGPDSEDSACSAGVPGSLLGSGRSPGEGNGNPLQCSCLENPTDRGSLVGYSPWGGKESDMTERLTLSLHSDKGLTVPQNQDETTGARKGAPTLRRLARAAASFRVFSCESEGSGHSGQTHWEKAGPWTFTTRNWLGKACRPR